MIKYIGEHSNCMMKPCILENDEVSEPMPGPLIAIHYDQGNVQDYDIVDEWNYYLCIKNW